MCSILFLHHICGYTAHFLCTVLLKKCNKMVDIVLSSLLQVQVLLEEVTKRTISIAHIKYLK